ncbi:MULTISPECIES: hypothetical protein [Olivibacter]|uniref:Metalloprotease n=1 Tax=Olivibacter jilunii TaxID=985016 RepID=A0ABW6B2K1_9SPHI
MKVIFITCVVFLMAAAFQTRPRICSARVTPIAERYQLFGSSGNAIIDQVTNQELLLLQSSFLVYPIFYFYDDSEGRNAKATDEVTNQRGPDGTVIFGRRLFNREFVRSSGGTTIPIIIAHEYAHIVDFKYGVLEHASQKKKEIFSDVFAGMYMYVRGMKGWATDLSAVQQCFEEMGDTDFGNEEHHGTPEERTRAVFYGYNLMLQNHSQGVFVDLNMAIKFASSYVEQLDEDDDLTRYE